MRSEMRKVDFSEVVRETNRHTSDQGESAELNHRKAPFFRVADIEPLKRNGQVLAQAFREFLQRKLQELLAAKLDTAESFCNEHLTSPIQEVIYGTSRKWPESTGYKYNTVLKCFVNL